MCSIVAGIRDTVEGSAVPSTGFRIIKAVPPTPSSRVLRSSLQVVGPRPVMKATTGGSGGLLFSDQLKQIGTWFDGWNDCEQTVALCSLLKRLNPLQGRFLTHCLQSFHADSFELPLLENRANSCEYLESLHGLSPDILTTHLLQHLQLLRPGHDEIRARYLGLIEDVLSYALETGTLYVECRQILSYSLMHPAFTAGDRTALKRWTQRLEYFTTGNFGHVNATTSPAAVVTTSNGTNHVNGCGGLSNGHDHQPRQQQQSNATNKAPSIYGGQVSSQPSTVHQQVPVSRLDNWTNGSSVNEDPHSPPRLVSASSANTMLSAFNGSVRSTSIGGGADLHGSAGTNNYADADAINQLAVRLNTVSFFTPPQTESSDVTNNMIDLNKSYCPSAKGNGLLNGRTKRSNSLTPPSSLSSSSSLSSILNGGGCNGVGSGLCGQLAAEESGRVKPRSMSLSSCSGPLSPQSNLGSSAYNSEGHLEDYNFDNVGMKVIPTWLKGLRLHKYKGIFSRLTYNQIFEMTEVSLTAQGVTKGARDKIILSIQKLKIRQDLLRSHEENLHDGGSIRNALLALGGVIDSPLIPFHSDAFNGGDETGAISEGNLPGQITRFFGKISLQLLKRPLEEDSMHQFLELIDKCMNHEAFSDSQKRRLTMLYQQVREECRSPRRGSDYRHNRGRLNRNYGGGFGGVGSGQVRLGSYANGGSPNHNQYVLEQRRTSGPVVLQSTKSPSADICDYFHHEQQQQRRSSLAIAVNGDLSRSPPPPMISVDHPLLLNNQLSIPSLYNKRGSLQENNSHTLLVRAKSAPDPHNQYQLFGNGKSGGSGIINTENDFINGLESVSRSVTEHALGDSG